ncbi:binding-protein-dependent transport systems inner membrane component [Xylanimonas cellulosilytica DSM 15894]|uniref:Binding-protein-dependent transport systems inner membrane component n=1 Tax=Xylanimonas cellulosilytica (strain DSM 15894 / JCM 12276 / CECT 5975 / KCTC 9989 / LMG 20990 / NBRC 107835 / XIL07) TaxID=446471 RepID=D1BZ02_XYLCX|nr:sugar ABC transporter permease [Xylanimonas cellulosilytica]ACZ30077.1 binding-protein-dependent transport systems inner membrane component [Xylanimonas cellulosilytica DSM 15894]
MATTTVLGAPVRQRRKPVTPYLLMIPAVAVLLLGLGYPVYWQIVTSFQEFGLAQQFGQPPTFAGLDNYARIFADDRTFAVVVRSIVFCLVTAFSTVILGLLLALLMRAVHGAVKVILQIALLLAWATPVVASVTVFRWLFDSRTGVINWLLVQAGLTQYQGHNWLAQPLSFFFVAALIIVWMSVPFVALSLFAGLTQVPDELLEAARIDGAGSTQILVRILMPLVRPVLAIVLLLQIIWNLRVFAQIRLLQDAGADVRRTNLLGNLIYELGMGSQNFGGAAAVSIFVLLLTIALSAPYVRSLMKEDAA